MVGRQLPFGDEPYAYYLVTDELDSHTFCTISYDSHENMDKNR